MSGMPHHTSATRVGGNVHLRTLFAVVPEMERLVRERIDFALTGEAMPGPDGVATGGNCAAAHPALSRLALLLFPWVGDDPLRG